MTERDLLERAAGALRAEHDGKRPGAGFTRARIMNSLHQQKRRRLSWWITFGPALALLIGGSAWAQSSGHWPLILRSVAVMFTPFTGSPEAQHAQERSQPSAPARAHAAPTAAATPPPTPRLDMEAEANLQALEELPELLAPALSDGAGPAKGAASSKPGAPPRRSENEEREGAALSDPDQAQQPVTTPSVPDPDPELAVFRRAHDLHFKQGSPAAVSAYEDYLRRYPSGRFVPEARYMLALGALKRGDHAEAKRRLRPFADGVYGPNRQAAARALLDSLE